MQWYCSARFSAFPTMRPRTVTHSLYNPQCTSSVVCASCSRKNIWWYLHKEFLIFVFAWINIALFLPIQLPHQIFKICLSKYYIKHVWKQFQGMNKARLKPTQHNPGGHNDIIHYYIVFICNTGEPQSPQPIKGGTLKESDIEVMLFNILWSANLTLKIPSGPLSNSLTTINYRYFLFLLKCRLWIKKILEAKMVVEIYHAIVCHEIWREVFGPMAHGCVIVCVSPTPAWFHSLSQLCASNGKSKVLKNGPFEFI